MSARSRRTDRHIRRLPLPTDADVAQSVTDHERDALFDAIVATPPESPLPSGHRNRQRRPALVAASAAGLAMAAAGVAAAIGSVTSTTTTVACHDDLGGISIIDATTGNPVEDCRQQLLAEGLPAGPLVAYDNAEGGVEVLPADQRAPDHWRPLDRSEQQDVALLELDDALTDSIDGLNADCYALDEAASVVRRHLERIGLNFWVVGMPSSTSPNDGCTNFALDPERRTVHLAPTEGARATGSPGSSEQRFVDELRTSLTDRCTSTAEAVEAIERSRERAAFDAVVSVGPATPPNDCARVYLRLGGRNEVVVRGGS